MVSLSRSAILVMQVKRSLTVDFAGTGSAGGMMAGVPVHQGIVLFETNFFKGVEYAHVRLSLKKKLLKSGRIDPVRFVSQDSECNGFSCQLNGFHFVS